MSKAPARRPAPSKRSTRSRSFERKQIRDRERAARRRTIVGLGQSPDLRRMLARVPRAAWICALIALVNSTAWSIITPPFQGRDEVDHFSYVALLAHGTTPQENGRGSYSQQELAVLIGLHYGEVRFTPYISSISSTAEQQALTRAVNAGLPTLGPGEAEGTTREPPLFYALQTIPYGFGAGNILTQLQLMRLFDALLGAITVLLTFFFLREILPGVPWAATVGTICVALQPTFAFTTGSLNPSALLFAVSAGIFLCLAIGFRRRFTLRIAIALGLLLAAGFLTYFSFIGVAVGAFVGLAILAMRDYRSRGSEALAAPGTAFGIGLAPPVIDLLVKIVSNTATFGQVSTIGNSIGLSSLFKALSYTWQLYLPRLPGMSQFFPGITTWKDIWFDRSVGLYGWMDTMFPAWVNNAALVPAAAIMLLFGRALFMHRAALLARMSELASYFAITIATMGMIGFASFYTGVIAHAETFGELRYLLPMLPLLGAVITLAIRGAGTRWVPLVGTAMIVLFFAHDFFSQLQVVGRYYG